MSKTYTTNDAVGTASTTDAQRTKDPTSAPKVSPPKIVTFENTLKCALTDEELQAKGAQLADAIDEGKRLDEEFTGVKQQFKAKIDGASARAAGLASTIRAKAEYRSVKCSRRYDFANGEVREYRDDTMTEISRRAMTNDDRQQHLPLEDRQAPIPFKENDATSDKFDDATLLANAAAAKPDNDFVASVQAWFDEHGTLTDAQREALENIINE